MHASLETSPRVPGDQSLAFLSEGYRFGAHRFDRLGTDVFSTRLLLRPVTLLRGADASRFFYEGERFTRDRALPVSVLHSLQDDGSVQTLTGGSHRLRKGIFLDLMTPGSMASLVSIFRAEWLPAVEQWSRRDRVVRRVVRSAGRSHRGGRTAERAASDRRGRVLHRLHRVGASAPSAAGGYAADGHRCPGEEPTVDLIAEAVRLLTTTMRYRVPDQDLRVSLRHLPALPQSGFVLTGVRPVLAEVSATRAS